MGRKRIDKKKLKKSITITLVNEDLEELKKIAEKKGDSVNQYITKVVENYLKK